MKRKDLVTGVLLIGIGLIFLASNLGRLPGTRCGADVADGSGHHRRRPALLGDAEGRMSGLTLVLTGAIFLAHTYRVVRLHDSWPLFIVIAGLSVMFGSLGRKVEGKKP